MRRVVCCLCLSLFGCLLFEPLTILLRHITLSLLQPRIAGAVLPFLVDYVVLVHPSEGPLEPLGTDELKGELWPHYY